jgi:hypothetical protein
MARVTANYNISAGLIDFYGRSLSLNILEVKNLNISDRRVINVNNGAGIIDMSECTFKDITRIGAGGKGGVIEADLGNSNGLLTISRSTFTNCLAEDKGGVIFANANEG